MTTLDVLPLDNRMSEISKKSMTALIFIISAATILLEMLLIKFCNVLLNSTASFLLLSLALFSLCSAGSVLYFLTQVKHYSASKVFVFSVLLFLLFASLSLPVLRLISLESGLKIVDSFAASFLVMLVMILPFLSSGMCILILLGQKNGDNFHLLYSADLLGIVVAVFLPRLLIPHLGPEQQMALAMLTVIFVFGLSYTKVLSNFSKFSFLICIIFNGFVLFGQSRNTMIVPVIEKYMPRGLALEKIEFSIWDPIARIDVVDFTNPAGHVGINKASQATKYVFYDGGTIGTNIYPYDGNAQYLLANYKDEPKKYFLRLGTVAAHLLKKDTGYKAYLFGVGAGQELKAALVFGAQKIYANELVKAVVDLSKKEYAFYNGNIFNSDKVQVLIGDGRLQLNALSEKFDVIQIFSNYLSANMAAGFGSFQVSYLFTVESMREYLDHLADDGILQINQFNHLRLLAVMARAWADQDHKLEDFRKHIYVIRSQDRRDILPTILFKKSAFTKEEDQLLRQLFDIETKNNFFLAEAPFMNEPTELSKLIANDFEKSAIEITDDRPFFGSNDGLLLNFFGVNKIAYFTILILIFLMTVFYFRKISVDSSVKALVSTNFYFLFCGLSFILTQVSFVQILLKYLNWPDLAFPLVVGGMALGAAVFNFLLGRWKNNFNPAYIFISGGIFIFLTLVLNLIFDAVSGFNNLSAIFIFFILFSITGFTGGSFFSYAVWKLKMKSSDNNLYSAWLFNGTGVLLASIFMHGFFLKFGHQKVLVSVAILSWLGFYFFEKNGSEQRT